MDLRGELIAIYQRVVAALSAERLARDACQASWAQRAVPGGKLFALGLGKVAAEMLRGAQEALGPELVPRALAVPRGSVEAPWIFPGGHPLPDEGSLRAGEALLSVASSLRARDAVLLLVSGGGSALAEAQHPGLGLAELCAVNDALLKSGAPIEEMNAVRSHLSRLKGGGLARALHRAGVRSARALVLVDVPEGGFSAVSSGPSAADRSRFDDALGIVRDREIELPAAAIEILQAGARGELPETLKPGEPADFVEHEVLCDLRAPAQEAVRGVKWPAEALSRVVRGPLDEVVLGYAAFLAGTNGRRLLAASGEPELKVPPDAPPGGRAQHLALYMARVLRGTGGAFLAAGTDGRDGPTEAAGAAVDGATWEEAERRGLRPGEALARFAASGLLEALGLLIPAQRTGAHAGDLHLVLSG